MLIDVVEIEAYWKLLFWKGLDGIDERGGC